ncbi:MAG: amino acid adenylation domain-containing protein [Betaproteobacteria bacterium]|nr:amino acid adenylation domain-containing protein [Betaproteobacteria bacterium]
MTAAGAVQLTAVDYDPFASPELARAVPTTDAQREVWLAAQLGREASLAFNESITIGLRGALRVQALQDALLALTDRHESLRATFSADGASMLIAPRGGLQARLRDLTQPAAGGPSVDEAMVRLKHDEVTTPFDLVHGPLVRATLATLGEAEHALVITAHHIVCDGWSFGVIVRELLALYAAFDAGGQPRLPAPDSFGDYVLATLEGEPARAAEADERYWVSMFEGSVPALDLPADRLRRAVRGFASERVDVTLPPALVEAARKLGAAQGASLFATLFSLFAALMARLANDADVVVGVPAAGQATMGMRTLVGHCVSLLPVRVLVDPAQPTAALLRHGRERVLDATEHAHCTFGRLLTRLPVARDAGRLPLVSVQFNLDTAIDAAALAMPGMTARVAANARAFENFDLFVNASQVDGAIVLECQFNAALFDAATVRGWLHLYRAAIERAAGDATLPVAALFAATDDDLRSVSAWNATRCAWPEHARIEQLLAEQAARCPDAVAVRDGEDALTYRELDERADALAAALQAGGVGAGHLVGLACGRNRHLLVALIGILRSGAGYVPLDPGFPAERLAYMQSDSGLAWLVSDRSVPALPRPDNGVGELRVLLADEVRPGGAAPVRHSDTNAPAYVIYTSGSTGKPKGVVVPQRAVVNFLASMARVPGLAAGDRLVAVTTTSFDIAVLELLLPLTVGAEVIVATRDEVMDGAALRALVERHRASAMQATPSGWRLLVDAGWHGAPGFKALVGGEPLPPDLARALLARTGELWNMYGPTETTVWSTCWRVEGGAPISIGTPIANTTVDVLDERGQPCPVGVPGEIVIGGEGVSTGYLHRPELTAERFVADPARPGQRRYRTGDRGRWRNDGLLEHLGRLDTQVKVRGYRIELAEIESVLVGHDSVERAVVVTREDTPGDVRIVAYVVCTAPAPPEAALREHLRRTLPEYMLPAHFVQLPQIPLLPNGKVNRRALPAPQPEPGRGRERAAAAPTNALEAQVLKAMEDVLHLPGLGVDDDLFAMGGHSLLAARLTARLNTEFGIALPLRAIFEAPTAARLAAAVLRQRQEGAPRRTAIERLAAGTDAPLTVMQERIRFIEQMQPGRVVYNTPSAHRLRGPFDRAAFEAAFRTVVQRQASLRTVIAQGADGRPVQRVLERLGFELPLVDLGGLPPEEREAGLMRRLQAIVDEPITIDRAPLFRVALFRLASDEHVFLFMPHHIIWDGWSFDLLYQEMSALLAAASAGRTPALAALPVSYADYAAWHARWMQGDECRTQLTHWKRRFAPIEPPRALPTDRPRVAGMTGAGAVEWVHVGTALTERLRRVAIGHGVTLNMLIMAVYATMLSQASASRSLVLGIPVRGRLASEVEPVMGFFNNLLPLPLAVPADGTLPAWLAVVKRELIDAFAHQDVPFERLAGEREIAAHAGKAGLYQSLFSFQDARERERRWGPLDHSSVLIMQKGATEDFGLWLMEVPGGLEGGINYNADLFDRATAQLFRERLVGLLRLVAEAPDTPLASLGATGAGSEAFAAWIRARHGAQQAEAAPASRPAAAAGGLSDRQRAMAAIWARVLGLAADDITAEDNFLDLGGSSLRAMEAMAACERELGLRIEPRRFVFEPLHQLAATAPETPARPAAATASPPAPKAAPDGRLARWLGKLRQGSTP